MQACSLLLGRPWQFDRESVHNGKTNHYSLMHNGKKIGLKPMTPEQILKDDLARASRAKTEEKNKSENQIDEDTIMDHVDFNCLNWKEILSLIEKYHKVNSFL